VAVAAVALLAGCSSADAARPEPGPGGGPVSVEVNVAPAPGATVALELSSTGERDVGSACATVDRWERGGWRSTWWWARTSTTAQAIPRGGEVTCPAIGLPLPTRMTLTLPDDLAPGTWRIAYAAADDLGAYVFEVR
jgi:hypothetical protein